MEDKKRGLKWLDWLFTLALGIGLIYVGMLWANYLPILAGIPLLFLCGRNLWLFLKPEKKTHK